MIKKHTIFIFSSVVIILLVPIIGMQFSEEVSWSSSDFIFMAVLLSITALLCEAVFRLTKHLVKRCLLCGIILLFAFLIWVEMAVGLFGSFLSGN